MINLEPVLGIVIVVNALTIWAAVQDNPFRLRGLVVLKLCIIGMLTPKLVDIGPWTTNMSGAIYASVFCSFAIMIRRWGVHIARQVVPMLAFSMIAFYSMLLATLLPSASRFGNGFTEMARELLLPALGIVPLTMCVMVLSLSALAAIMARFSAWWGAPLGLLASQAIDALVFYPIAYSSKPIDQIFEIAVVGMVFKVCVLISLAPAYFIGTKVHPRHHPSERLRET